MDLKLTDGRERLWQWDTGCAVACDGQVEQLHMATLSRDEALTMEAAETGRLWIAPIPDRLLQSALPLRVWGVAVDDKGHRTRVERVFPVTPRPKPSDYVATPDEALSYETLAERMGELSDLATQDKSSLVAAINEAAQTGGSSGGGGGGIVKSVNSIPPDENGNVDVDPTPDDALALLDEAGVACAIADEGGAVLTDDADNILIY